MCAYFLLKDLCFFLALNINSPFLFMIDTHTLKVNMHQALFLPLDKNATPFLCSISIHTCHIYCKIHAQCWHSSVYSSKKYQFFHHYIYSELGSHCLFSIRENLIYFQIQKKLCLLHNLSLALLSRIVQVPEISIQQPRREFGISRFLILSIVNF